MKKKDTKQKNVENENIITETVVDIRNSEWKNIGRKKKWSRRCPKCKRTNVYTNSWSYNRAVKLNLLCQSCCREKNGPTPYNKKERKWKRNCPQCNFEISYVYQYQMKNANLKKSLCRRCVGINFEKNMTIEQRRKHKVNCLRGEKHPFYGIKRDKSVYEKISKANKGIRRRPIDYVYTDEHRRKLRLSTINRISKQKCNGGQLFPRYNINACKFIDEYGKKNGYNFQHAENGGEFFIKELGYWVDGYDRKKNVVFEYNEPRHNRNRDMRRIKQIKRRLRCKFICYDEKLNRIEFL